MSNKNKNLLSESTVRRFMTLASLKPISNTFIQETFREEEENLEEETQTDDTGEGTLEESDETEALDEMGMGAAYNREDEDLPEEEAPEMEAPEEEAPEEPAAAPAGMEEFAREVASALADAIQRASGGAVSVSVEDSEAPAEDAEPAAAEEPISDEELMADEEEGPEDMPVAETTEDAELETLEEEDANTEISAAKRDEIVQEVYNRIAKRLLKSRITK